MVNEKPFKLDMPFEEALRRFAQTDDKELPERSKLKRRKEAGGRSPPAKSETRSKATRADDANVRARIRRGGT
jgi:hypothetical protein